MSKPPIFRFAPSPNGLLHRGHAYSALLNQHLALRLGGRFLLRIEDIDHGRARPQFERQILEDLAWLGIVWEQPVLRQSEHLAVYGDALARLERLGVLYPCFATRREILAQARAGALPLNPDGAPVYSGLHRDLDPDLATARIEAGEPYVLRLHMQKALAIASARGAETGFTAWQPDGSTATILTDPSVWGDVVLARKEVRTSYALAVVVDDARQGVSHVVRGMDLYHATSVQRLLQILLDLPAPLYHHHQLLFDEGGRKLAKSARSQSLGSLREAGLAAQHLILQLPPFPLD